MRIDYNGTEMNALMAISLLQEDLVFFRKEDIEMQDGHHVIKTLQFNKDEIDNPKFKIIKDNLEAIAKCFVDVCYHVENNEKLKVKLSKIGFPIRPLIYFEDLTGLTLLNLFAHHVLFFHSPEENVCQIVIHPNVVENLPNARELVDELMKTLISYNNRPADEVKYIIYDEFEVYREDNENKAENTKAE
jgi:hypothetical protein